MSSDEGAISSFKLSLSDDQENMVLTKGFRKCKISIEEAFSELTLFNEEITFQTFRKIVIAAVREKSDDVCYNINENKNIIIEFLWKGLIEGGCRVVIPRENFSWNKYEEYKEICSNPELRPIMDYVNKLFEEKFKKDEVVKRVINDELIDFCTITKDKMAHHIGKYGFDIDVKESTSTLKSMLSYSKVYRQFCGGSLHQTIHIDETIDCQELNLVPKNKRDYLILNNIPRSNINLVISKDKITIDGRILLNIEHYDLISEKNTRNMSAKKLFAKYKICKLDDVKPFKSKSQYVPLRWGQYQISSNGVLRYILFTDGEYLVLETLDILTHSHDNPYTILAISNLEEFTKTVVIKTPDGGSCSGGMYADHYIVLNKKMMDIDYSQGKVTRDFIYFDLNKVELLLK